MVWGLFTTRTVVQQRNLAARVDLGRSLAQGCSTTFSKESQEILKLDGKASNRAGLRNIVCIAYRRSVGAIGPLAPSLYRDNSSSSVQVTRVLALRLTPSVRLLLKHLFPAFQSTSYQDLHGFIASPWLLTSEWSTSFSPTELRVLAHYLMFPPGFLFHPSPALCGFLLTHCVPL
jgi:hypothetical protein